ncbi:MAG: hypothetical protein FD135_1276 [Comamonadaceae bacterium]|nr:MAG: hypothetical protein FD135_1276 [Comamonadaceae bacterium]
MKHATNTISNNHSNVQHVRRFIEITIGTDPQTLVDQAVADVRHDGLRRVLELCCSATEVRQVLTSLSSSTPGYVVSPIQTLRRAAETARLWWAFGAQEGEVLYVSTFIQGCQDLLAASSDGLESAQDRMFAIIRPALFKLDEHHPRQAWLLRQSLGRGNVDEEDEQEVPRLRESVRRALLASRQPGRHGIQADAHN